MPGQGSPRGDSHMPASEMSLGDVKEHVAWLLQNGGAGSPGPQGDPGPQGPKGDTGDQGPAGEDGADGAAGAAGAAGADGKTWHSGAGAPGAGVGVNGDFYLDLTADAYYGPKASGSWAGTGPTSLIGPEGPAGPEGPEGPPGEPGAHEHAGEDITSGTVAIARLPSELLTGAEADAAYAALGHTHSIYSVTSHNHDATYAALGHNHDATYQPLDSDLTALAALATNAAGRSILVLADPNADRIAFWDDSAGAYAHLAPGNGLTISGTDITAGAPAASAVATNVNVTTTAEIQLATVSLNTVAGRKYLINASVRFLKDTGTTTRAETLRLRRTNGSGTILTESGGASSAVASSPFGAALTYIDTPGAATPFTWFLSAINFASSTIVAAFVSLNVVELA